MSRSRGRIWIQGAGELASGVAVRLVHSGYRVVMAEIPAPLAVRRLVSFSEAIYAGQMTVEGVCGRLVDPESAGFESETVTVLIDPDGEQLPGLRPDAVIDARLTKKDPEPLPRLEIPLIGLGPGFVCGQDADLIVETHRGARLGEVITTGSAAPNTGVPGVVGGEAARRVVRAPGPGRLAAVVEIGDLVSEGEILGTVGGVPLNSPLTGRVRGLISGRVELVAGLKVGDVDPRGAAIDPALVSDKALAIGGGVLEALLRLRILPATGD